VLLRSEDVESMRRSMVAGPLPLDACQDLVETCERLLAEREAVRRILESLPAPFADVRTALNDLYRLTGSIDAAERSSTGPPARPAPASR
jgi:hypothetical protein